MKIVKLNNKGITTIEVIISFVIIVIIASSLFNTISAYNQKRLIENYKSKIYTYKNTLTKTIEDDFVKIGLTSVNYTRNLQDNMIVNQLDCTLKDGTTRRLIIKQRFTRSDMHPDGSENSGDYFMIEYGKSDLTKSSKQDQNANLTEYPLPDLGHYTAKYKGVDGQSALDLTINKVSVSLENDSATKNATVLALHIGFYHPELLTRYGINIVTPINYVASD